METQIPFPTFMTALKDRGVTVSGGSFLSDSAGAWAAVSPADRAAVLAALQIPADADAVELGIGKRPNSAKSIENVLVIFTWPDGASSAPAAETSASGSGRSRGRRNRRRGKDADAPSAAATPTPMESESEDASGGEADFEFAVARTPASTGPSRFDEEGTPSRDDAPQHAPAPEIVAPAATASASLPAADTKRPGLFGRFGRPAAQPPAPADAQAVPGAAHATTPSDGAPAEGAQADQAHPAEPPVTVIPADNDPDLETVELYAVQEPYAFIRIQHSKSRNEHIYELIEPALDERERHILAFIENTLVDVLEVGLKEITAEGASEMLHKNVDEIIYDYSIALSPLSREKILYYILRDFLGFGRLDPIMRDEYIEDVSCDGPGVPIFLYHRKYESLRSTLKFANDDEADSYVIRMAQRSGKHVSIAEPLLDATLPDGSRLNATLSNEVTAGGSTFTIRKFREDPFTVPDLVRFGTMNEDLLAYWWLAVQNGASAIYAGGTASGKTTSLNAILLFIPPQMKIVSIEDTREINIPHENWIAGVTRSGFGPRDNNGRQAGEIDMFTLLKAALRQRPEYILVGEVRGQEATALFQAMATGHTAYGTMHADSTESVIHRLESEPISIPRSLLEALDVVSIQIQTRIGDRRVRRTKELVEIVGLDPHTREILTNEVFNWNSATDEFEFSGVSYVLERIQMERNLTEPQLREEFERRKRVIRWMVDNEVRALADVGRIIGTYYKDPDAVLALVETGTDGRPVAEALVALGAQHHADMVLAGATSGGAAPLVLEADEENFEGTDGEDADGTQ